MRLLFVFAILKLRAECNKVLPSFPTSLRIKQMKDLKIGSFSQIFLIFIYERLMKQRQMMFLYWVLI